jgi:hypothetical protein
MLESKLLLSNRSNLSVIYLEYLKKSSTYLFSFERGEWFWDIKASDVNGAFNDNTIYIPDNYDGLFYEWAIYCLVWLLSVFTAGGLRTLKPGSFGQKMNSLRFCLTLAIGPSLLGKALYSQRLFWFYRDETDRRVVGNTMSLFQQIAWIALVVVMIFDWMVLLTSGLKDKKSIIYDTLEDKNRKYPL